MSGGRRAVGGWADTLSLAVERGLGLLGGSRFKAATSNASLYMRSAFHLELGGRRQARKGTLVSLLSAAFLLFG